MTNLLDEKLQILSFGKSGQLAAVADADVYQLLNAVVSEQVKEMLGTFFRESDGE
jgi:hypothetical protein